MGTNPVDLKSSYLQGLAPRYDPRLVLSPEGMWDFLTQPLAPVKEKLLSLPGLEAPAPIPPQVPLAWRPELERAERAAPTWRDS